MARDEYRCYTLSRDGVDDYCGNHIISIGRFINKKRVNANQFTHSFDIYIRMPVHHWNFLHGEYNKIV